MANRIKELYSSILRLTPTEAVCLFGVYPERVTNRTEVRGRLTGPRCPYATTVEVAYPLRESSREYEKYGIPHISMRAIIPEPNLCDPASPFCYQCTLELWDGEQCCRRPERA